MTALPFSNFCADFALAMRSTPCVWPWEMAFGKNLNRRILTMSRKSPHLIPGIVLMAAAIFPMSLTWAQAPTLQEQLAAQYKLVKMGSDTSGYSVVEKGTLMAIQKGGILAVPYGDQSVLSTKYEDGTPRGESHSRR